MKSPTSEVLNFTSDASKNKHLGWGATFGSRWMFAQWPEGFIQECDPSIEHLELFALVSAIITWTEEELLCNGRITVFCDNEAVVHMVNNSASGCMNCLKVIRVLTLQNLKYNRRIFV